MHPGDQKLTISEGLFSIASFHLFLTPSSHLSLFNTPDLHHPHYLTLGHMILLVQTIIHL